jgi:hypothetical protein
VASRTLGRALVLAGVLGIWYVVAGAQQPPAKEVVLTAFYPVGPVRWGDADLVTRLARAVMIDAVALSGDAPLRVYAGRGPTTVPWVFGRFQRGPEPGVWRFWVEMRDSGGVVRSATAAGRPAEALRRALCQARIVQCAGS